MAAVKNSDIPEVFQMFGDSFNLLKKFYTPEQNDVFWEDLKTEAETIRAKYNTQLCKEILTAISNDIGTREVKKKNG